MQNEGEPAQQYQIKVTLLHVRPPVWRRLIVPGHVTLGALHRILQTAMGWHNMHLHDFEIDGVFYGRIIEEEDEDVLRDETRVRLDQVARAEGARFRYRYDFGDEWRHEVLVEDIAPPRPSETPVRCLAGRRSAPPEDCGGAPGYAMLLAALKQPSHPAYRDWIESYGDFDPAFFDLAAVNRALAALE